MLNDFSDSFPLYGDEQDFERLKKEFKSRHGKDISGVTYSKDNYFKIYNALSLILSAQEK
jgi:hypothetical protein